MPPCIGPHHLPNTKSIQTLLRLVKQPRFASIHPEIARRCSLLLVLTTRADSVLRRRCSLLLVLTTRKILQKTPRRPGGGAAAALPPAPFVPNPSRPHSQRSTKTRSLEWSERAITSNDDTHFRPIRLVEAFMGALPRGACPALVAARLGRGTGARRPAPRQRVLAVRPTRKQQRGPGSTRSTAPDPFRGLLLYGVLIALDIEVARTFALTAGPSAEDPRRPRAASPDEERPSRGRPSG